MEENSYKLRFQTLDNIVRSSLMQKNYSLHWYIQALKSASDCLRELTFDSLRNINTVRLAVSATGTADLPCDCVDIIKVGLERGQYIKPLVQKDSINRLKRVDSTGTVIKYDKPTFDTTFYDAYDVEDDYCEPMFGFNAGWLTDGYKALRERGEIQLDQNVATDFIYLEYISDGQCSDNATRIHPYAQKTIEAYIFWKFKEHNRSYGLGDAREEERKFSAERRTLRARLNPLTKDDYVRIARKGYSATIKG